MLIVLWFVLKAAPSGRCLSHGARYVVEQPVPPLGGWWLRSGRSGNRRDVLRHIVQSARHPWRDERNKIFLRSNRIERIEIFLGGGYGRQMNFIN